VKKDERARVELILNTPGLKANGQGALVIDETGDRKAGHKMAHVGRQYLADLGEIGNGVISLPKHRQLTENGTEN
jgi:SRSO17 transposase